MLPTAKHIHFIEPKDQRRIKQSQNNNTYYRKLWVEK